MLEGVGSEQTELGGGDGARVVDGEVAPVALELERVPGKM